MKLPLSVVLITLNSERTLRKSLNSVKSFADEILVLDSGSTDRTAEISRECGAQFMSEGWRGFGPQKQRAVTLARNDWVFCLDSDEEVSPELQVQLKLEFENLKPEICYRVPRKSFFFGRWIKHGGWYPDYQARLFHRAHGRWSDDVIHEYVKSVHYENLKGGLSHDVFENVAHQVMTNNRYSTLTAQKKAGSQVHFSLFRLVTRPIFKFFENYVLKAGFLDGLAGYVIAKNASYSIFLREIKLWEIERSPQPPLITPVNSPRASQQDSEVPDIGSPS